MLTKKFKQITIAAMMFFSLQKVVANTNYIISILSWKYIETPIMKLKERLDL